MWFGAVLRAEVDSIRIGAKSNVQDNATLHSDHGCPVVIGDCVSVGHNAIVHGAIVEDGCLIGMHATVLNGARIGKGSLIAAGALVKEGEVIPERSLVIGVPGKVIRMLDDATVEHNLSKRPSLRRRRERVRGKVPAGRAFGENQHQLLMRGCAVSRTMGLTIGGACWGRYLARWANR